MRAHQPRDPDERDPRQQQTTPPHADRPPRRLLPQLAIADEKVDRPASKDAESD